MRTSILVTHTSDGVSCQHGPADVVRAEYKVKRDKAEGFDRIELWDCSGGIRKRFSPHVRQVKPIAKEKAPEPVAPAVESAAEDVPEPEPVAEKRRPGRSRKNQ